MATYLHSHQDLQQSDEQNHCDSDAGIEKYSKETTKKAQKQTHPYHRNQSMTIHAANTISFPCEKNKVRSQPYVIYQNQVQID